MDKIKCLIWGFEGKSLTAHIRIYHNLDAKRYKEIYGGRVRLYRPAWNKGLDSNDPRVKQYTDSQRITKSTK